MRTFLPVTGTVQMIKFHPPPPKKNNSSLENLSSQLSVTDATEHPSFSFGIVINPLRYILWFSCRLIAICEDIYAARAEGELGVEEVLYWTLVKIYRSPHMLLEYTKPD